MKVITIKGNIGTLGPSRTEAEFKYYQYLKINEDNGDELIIKKVLVPSSVDMSFFVDFSGTMIFVKIGFNRKQLVAIKNENIEAIGGVASGKVGQLIGEIMIWIFAILLNSILIFGGLAALMKNAFLLLPLALILINIIRKIIEIPFTIKNTKTALKCAGITKKNKVL